MDVFFPVADSNQIPVQSPCRHCPVSLEKLSLMHVCVFTQRAGDIFSVSKDVYGCNADNLF